VTPLSLVLDFELTVPKGNAEGSDEPERAMNKALRNAISMQQSSVCRDRAMLADNEPTSSRLVPASIQTGLSLSRGRRVEKANVHTCLRAARKRKSLRR